MPDTNAQLLCEGFFRREEGARVLDFENRAPKVFFGNLYQTCERYGILLLGQETHTFGRTEASDKINLCPAGIKYLEGVAEVEACYQIHNSWRKNGGGKMLPYQKQIFMENPGFGMPPKEFYLTTGEVVSEGYRIDGLQLHFGGAEVNLNRNSLSKPQLECDNMDELPTAICERVSEFNKRY